MITKTVKSKLEKVIIELGEYEIKEAILEWLVNKGHHKNLEKDKNASMISTTLDLFEDNTAEFIIDYSTKTESEK